MWGEVDVTDPALIAFLETLDIEQHEAKVVREKGDLITLYIDSDDFWKEGYLELKRKPGNSGFSIRNSF